MWMTSGGDGGKTAVIVTEISVLTAMTLTFLILRLYCRIRYQKGFSLDDYLLVFGWILLAVSSGLTYTACAYGVGQHITRLAPEDVSQAIKYLVISGQVALAAACASQVSISVTLFRIGATRIQRWLLYGVIGLVIATKAISMFLIFTTCQPIEELWNRPPTPDKPGDGHKGNPKCHEWMFAPIVYFWVFSAAVSSTVDLILVALPWRILWGLQMRKMEKFGLGIAFTAGIFSAATSICEAIHIPKGSFVGDVTYSDLVMWTFAEPAVIIMAASVPFLHKLVQDLLKCFAKLSSATTGCLERRATACTTSTQVDNLLPSTSSTTNPYPSYPSPVAGPLTPVYPLTSLDTGSHDNVTPSQGGESTLDSPASRRSASKARIQRHSGSVVVQVPIQVEEAKCSGILKTSEVIVKSEPHDGGTNHGKDEDGGFGLGILDSGKPCGLADLRLTFEGTVVSRSEYLSTKNDGAKEKVKNGWCFGGGGRQG